MLTQFDECGASVETVCLLVNDIRRYESEIRYDSGKGKTILILLQALMCGTNASKTVVLDTIEANGWIKLSDKENDKAEPKRIGMSLTGEIT